MRITFLLLAALFAAPTVFAAETMYANDPNREMKEDVEDTYGMYILNPSRRHPKEKLEFNADNVEIWLYHDPRKVDLDKLKCDSIRWLILGRFGKGGAQPFFSNYAKFASVELDIFQLLSSRTVDGAGKYTVTKTPQTILKVKLTRKRADKMDYEATKKQLDALAKGEPDACAKASEKLIDAKWYNKDYK